MMILNDIKNLLRISNDVFDTEILDLIDAAKADLILSGVSINKADDDTDSLIKRAISTYTKANFGWDNSDSEKLNQSYNMLKQHLTLSKEYTFYAITFTVTDGTNPLENAVIDFDDIVKLTDSTGQVVFYGKGQTIPYTVKLDGFKDINLTIDVLNDLSVSVVMEAV